jgi:hypothetical protein
MTNTMAAPRARYADLTDEYGRWLEERNYQSLSADELLYELLGHEPRPVEDIRWLEDFIARWEAAD